MPCLAPELYEMRYRRRGVVHSVLLRCERLGYRSADHIVTVNEALHDVICGRGGRSAGDVTVVRNGPVLARVRGHRPAAELKGGKRFLCCWVGLMGPQDGLDLALGAIAELPTAVRAACRFVFIGDGECRSGAEALAVRLGISAHVDFPGWLHEDELFDYLATADLGLEPNLEETVSPVKGMEYMAFGVPYVAFDTAQTRRMSDGAARYAAPGDIGGFAELIRDLLADEPSRCRMADIGRRRVEEVLAWEHQAPIYVGVFRSVLAPVPARK